MVRILLHTIVTLGLLAVVLPTVNFASLTALIFASIIFAILFHFIKPILNILLFPVNFVTLGLFSALINIFLLWLVEYLVPGFTIQAMILFGLQLSYFWTLAVLSMLIGFTGSIIGKII